MNEIEKLRAENAELREALQAVTDLLNEPGVMDIDTWKRECRKWTSTARAILAKHEGREG